ncbi:hypothetical protein [Billgrantia endophytica]|uniref:hypothetical protein n=1 Tax=Billgrantia endophytica TaxID=2033802 RepID=UPI0010556B03|nr:hypothetical protein [Halomonas endophytica]
MREANASDYSPGAYRGNAIPPLPAPPRKRERLGEELLPFGDYADINPYQQLSEDMELVQHLEQENRRFYESDDWWWDHQRICFLKSQLGFSALLLVVPVLYFFFLLALFVVLGLTLLNSFPDGSGFGLIISTLVVLLGVPTSFVIGAYTTQHLMNGIVRLCTFLLTPFHKILFRHAYRYMENRRSEFNRQTGMVSFAQGKKKPPLVAPFVEFDGYVERVVSGFSKLIAYSDP